MSGLCSAFFSPLSRSPFKTYLHVRKNYPFYLEKNKLSGGLDDVCGSTLQTYLHIRKN
jgi:hypothetical protein